MIITEGCNEEKEHMGHMTYDQYAKSGQHTSGVITKKQKTSVGLSALQTF